MESASVDCCITDPPYNVGLEYASTDDNRSDYGDWCKRWFLELRRVVRGPIAISIGQANLSLWAAMFPPDWWYAWWKPNGASRCKVGFNNWEPIAFYGKAKVKSSDVIRAGIVHCTDTGDHPCPKPVEWASKQLELFTEPGEIVIDPFTGTGTTGVACLQADRRFIGIEKDAGYLKIANKRLEQSRPSLFADPRHGKRQRLFTA